MDRLFVDTWGWLALRDRSERRHGDVKKTVTDFTRDPLGIVTTDYVLDKAFTLLFRRLPFSIARESMQLLSAAIADQGIKLIPITTARFEAAQVLRLRYADKPDISFTDLCSMAVMTELGIRNILTEDAHFTQVGLGFQCLP